MRSTAWFPVNGREIPVDPPLDLAAHGADSDRFGNGENTVRTNLYAAVEAENFLLLSAGGPGHNGQQQSEK